ncbi:MAG: SGNH/GDSL hydrolase family protein [Pirellulaceae bacterium]|nr:SGNH/GDSL hydrolase family protein [Pirellulaceae bacterium]
MCVNCGLVAAQEKLTARPRVIFGPYEYEQKPDDPAFAKFNPRKAPDAGDLVIRKGDRLAIIGDSITEQKMYSRMMETYLTVCVPELEVTVRQYGWSGEKADGFLRRMDQDCLRFGPTLATLCYGMNDARYRPFDVTNGRWYRDHYTAVVRKLKGAGARVVLGSPGCSGKIATWVKSRSGTLDEHNLNLCALRDIGIQIASEENVRFADQFWPMYQQQVFAERKYSTPDKPYRVAGKDGIHPGWAGHVMMAYAFLRSMGLDGDLGTISINLQSGTTMATKGHTVDSVAAGRATITSSQYPFCARGELNDDNSIRSGMTLVPLNRDLNRLTLKVTGLTSENAVVNWGDWSHKFSATELANGINLADQFVENPFFDAFERVDQAVAAKQAFETHQIKREFHKKGRGGGDDAFEKLVAQTEAEREKLVEAIGDQFRPVTHTITVAPIAESE